MRGIEMEIQERDTEGGRYGERGCELEAKSDIKIEID
jgi:hypothetical protein